MRCPYIGFAIAAAGFGGLAGCYFSQTAALRAAETQRGDQERALAAAPNCCAGPAEFAWLELQAAKPLRARIGREGQAFEFPEGRSFFVAVRLPPLAQGTSLRMILGIEGTWGSGAATVVFPKVLFLDEAYNPVPGPANLRGVARWPFILVAATNYPTGLEVNVPISLELAEKARFAVVSVDPRYQGKAFYFGQNGLSAPFGFESDLEVEIAKVAAKR